MSYKVLARKWRPQVFEDVVGQEHVTKTLINAIRAERLAHAYLFGGSRGVGKTSVARIFAKAINCEQGEPGIPCNKCHSCVGITEGTSLDVQEIDGASNRGIDEIREIRDNIKYMPSSIKYRIYIIDEVHMLTTPAFNALLKTLEEPPAHAKFIFATTESNKVPVTVLSRCQRFDFKRIPLSKIIAHLKRIIKEEKIEISESGLVIIAREADGSMRDAESLLDQVISFTGLVVKSEDIIDILGIIDREIVFDISCAIIEGTPVKCLEIIDRVYNFGYDIKDFYDSIMVQFRNYLTGLVAPEVPLFDMSKEEREEAGRQAQMAGLKKLQLILSFLINQEQTIRFASNPRLVLEAVMLKLCYIEDFLSFNDLMTKIESLEKRLTTGRAAEQLAEPDHISDPAARYSPERPEENPSGRDQGDKSWEDLLKFLSSRSKVMYNVLKDWRLLKLDEGAMEIASGSQSFSSAFFNDTDHYNQLTDYCRDFFKRKIKIRISENNLPRNQEESPSETESPGANKEKHSDLPPSVQEILHLFQGEIKE